MHANGHLPQKFHCIIRYHLLIPSGIYNINKADSFADDIVCCARVTCDARAYYTHKVRTQMFINATRRLYVFSK